MKTEGGIELTKAEIDLIKGFEKLAKKWKKNTDRLWLFSASGTMTVMMHGDIASNPNPENLATNGKNPDNIVTTIDIPNDGGDW